MKTCPTFEQLGAYVDGELPGPLLPDLEAHLDSCQACAEEVASLRELEALTTSSLATPHVPPDEWASAWSAIADRIAVPRQRRYVQRRWVAWAAAAAAAIAIVAGLWARGTRRPPETAVRLDKGCVVEYVETAPGYMSMYSRSPSTGVTIITLMPEATQETRPDDESRNPT